MNVWLTPDLKPFVGGTYFPAKEEHGLPTFRTVLLRVADAWKSKRDQIVASSKEITSQLERIVQSDNYVARNRYDFRHILSGRCDVRLLARC